jgi:hypothetical protein
VPYSDKSFTAQKYAPREAKSSADFFSLDYLVELHRYKALIAVTSVGEELNRKIASGQNHDDAFNSLAIEMCEAVKAHCAAFMIR